MLLMFETGSEFLGFGFSDLRFPFNFKELFIYIFIV